MSAAVEMVGVNITVQAVEARVKVDIVPDIQVVSAEPQQAQQKLPEQKGGADGSAIGVKRLHCTAP
jgi:hypothetical protein